MENIDRIVQLLCLLAIGQIDDGELVELIVWAQKSKENNILFTKIQSKAELKELAFLYDSVYEGNREASIARMKYKLFLAINTNKVTSEITAKSTFYKFWKSVAAIAALLVITLVWYLNRDFEIIDSKEQLSLIQDIQPGGNKATLTLDGGRLIKLNNINSAIELKENQIQYEDGKPVFKCNSEVHVSNYSLSTPVSGQYRLQLPDGSEVWLNALSKISFPSKFNDKERLVEVDGEVYFAIKKAHNKSGKALPFKVINRNQIIEVLGTEFMISSYDKDKSWKTTLIHGSVRVTLNEEKNKSVFTFLKPGEQSNLEDGKFTKKKVNIEPLISWRSNLFYFENTPIKEVFAQLSRWYNIEVEYDGELENATIFGEFSRDLPLQKILNILKESRINFKLEKRNEKNVLIVRSENSKNRK